MILQHTHSLYMQQFIRIAFHLFRRSVVSKANITTKGKLTILYPI